VSVAGKHLSSCQRLSLLVTLVVIMLVGGNMFEWYKKKRLNEQIKFFGGTQKKFISCYAKQVKPRIRVKSDNLERITINFNPRYDIRASAQALFAQQQAIGMTMANMQAQNGSALAGLQSYGLSGNGGASCLSSYGLLGAAGVQAGLGGR